MYVNLLSTMSMRADQQTGPEDAAFSPTGYGIRCKPIICSYTLYSKLQQLHSDAQAINVLHITVCTSMRAYVEATLCHRICRKRLICKLKVHIFVLNVKSYVLMLG